MPNSFEGVKKYGCQTPEFDPNDGINSNCKV